MSVIHVENLTRSYGARRGITDVRLDVKEGSLYGFLGPNGAGKTTTIRVLLGFLSPTSGQASIFGLDCWRQSARIKRDVGYVPGDMRLYPWLNGVSALRLFGRIRGRDDMLARGREIAQRFELDLHLKVRKMSKGTRQKLGLVLAMAHEPRLLILDEPSSGLDPLMQDRFRDLIKEAIRQGRTVLLSSHSLSEVEDVCHRVAIVRAGRIVADDTIEALKKQAGHQVTIQWREPVDALAQPAFLKLDERSSRRWTGHVQGPIEALVTFLAGKPIEDLSIGRPDLESLFRAYYQTDESSNTDANRSVPHATTRTGGMTR